MFVEHNFFIGARDINSLKELTNTALLSYLEDIACIHSDMVGFGLCDIEKTQKTWILLSWKVKVIKRPNFSDTLKVKTWSRLIDKFYAYRDFEIYDNENNLVAIATSKWIFIDIKTGKIIKISEEVANAYSQENKSVFEEKDLEKLQEPENFINKIDYKITKNMIDVNNHLHNTYYMDLAKEVLPDEISFSNEINKFEIMYKHEIKLGETVKVMYTKKDDLYYVVIKNKEETNTHAIIKLEY